VPFPHAAHAVATGATEYCMAGQLEQVRSVVTVHAAALFLVPAGHTVQGVQALAPAADHELPAAQLAQFALAVAEHAEAR